MRQSSLCGTVIEPAKSHHRKSECPSRVKPREDHSVAKKFSVDRFPKTRPTTKLRSREEDPSSCADGSSSSLFSGPGIMSRRSDEEGLLCSFRMHGTARLMPRRCGRLGPTVVAGDRSSMTSRPRPPMADGEELFRRLWKGTVCALLQASSSGSSSAPSRSTSSVASHKRGMLRVQSGPTLYGPKAPPPSLRRGSKPSAGGNGRVSPATTLKRSDRAVFNSLKSVVR